LQTALAKRAPGAHDIEIDPGPGAAVRRTIAQLGAAVGATRSDSNAGGTLAGMARAAQLGPWLRSTLFASPRGLVTRLHYDHFDNIYFQLAGRKRVLLFHPLDAAGLLPFPVNHPLDQRSRVHLDALPAADDSRGWARVASAFPRLRETEALEVVLAPGDVLFIPHHCRDARPPAMPRAGPL
jgi:hypothetical protein